MFVYACTFFHWMVRNRNPSKSHIETYPVSDMFCIAVNAMMRMRARK